MERKKQIKLLEEIEKKKITEPIIPDYISLKPEKAVIKKNQTEVKGKKAASAKKARIKDDKRKKTPEKKSKNKSAKTKTKHKKTASTKPESKKNGK